MISAKKHYLPKTITASSAQEELVDCVVTEAQEWCNFVLFQISYLPLGFTISKQQLRKESHETQSSFRFLLENKKNNHHIAIKQFLYDWAPPAYDYPGLWLNTEKFSSDDIIAPRSLLTGNRVLWIGKNYRGQNAATIDLERTRIEITFDGITLQDEELTNIVQGLKPCDKKLRDQILNTPFVHLSYYARHKKNASEVPLSYWKHIREAMCYCVALSLDDEINDNWLPSHIINVLKINGYYLNGVFGITISENLPAVVFLSGEALAKPEAKEVEIVEKEYLFEHNQHPGIFVHVLVTPNSSIHPIKYPPTIGDQACEHKAIKFSKNEIYVAHSTQQYGNYEFVWKTQEMTFLMIIRAAPWVSNDWAINLSQKMQIN